MTDTTCSSQPPRSRGLTVTRIDRVWPPGELRTPGATRRAWKALSSQTQRRSCPAEDVSAVDMPECWGQAHPLVAPQLTHL